MTARSKKKPQRKTLRAELDAILRRVDHLPDLDPRTPDEIIGYDERGLPQSDDHGRAAKQAGPGDLPVGDRQIRPKHKVDTEPLTVPLDPATARMLEALEAYGRLGTTKQEIILHLLRSWLWENESRLREAIKSREAPFGPPQESE